MLDVAIIEILGVEFGFTVINNEFEVTRVGIAQFALEVISAEITSLFDKLLVIKEFEFVPIFTLFFFH